MQFSVESFAHCVHSVCVSFVCMCSVDDTETGKEDGKTKTKSVSLIKTAFLCAYEFSLDQTKKMLSISNFLAK